MDLNQQILIIRKHRLDIFEIAKTIGPVFPVDSVQKKPLHTGWQQEATRNPEGMEFPKGVGIKTGPSDGKNLVVMDVDTTEAEGLLQSYLTKKELDTYTVQSQNNGKHYYYFADLNDNFKSTTNVLVNGLDVRATGGQIISPPSIGYSVLNKYQLPLYQHI